MKKYLIIWAKLAHISFAEQLSSRFSSILFLLGKSARFLFFLIFLFTLVGRTNGLAGYTKEQVIIFFLIFNIVDISTQLLFRGVYFFRQKVVTGELDFYLTKPINPLFRILAGHPDILDLFTLVPLVGYFAWFIMTSPSDFSLTQLSLLTLMLFVSLLLGLAFHIAVVGVGIITTEVDHTIMIYRDLTQMARVPVDIYTQPVRVFLTYLVPIALMITFPAKVLIGRASPTLFLVSLVVTYLALVLTLRFWRYALTQYSSASS